MYLHTHSTQLILHVEYSTLCTRVLCTDWSCLPSMLFVTRANQAPILSYPTLLYSALISTSQSPIHTHRVPHTYSTCSGKRVPCPCPDLPWPPFSMLAFLPLVLFTFCPAFLPFRLSPFAFALFRVFEPPSLFPLPTLFNEPQSLQYLSIREKKKWKTIQAQKEICHCIYKVKAELRADKKQRCSWRKYQFYVPTPSTWGQFIAKGLYLRYIQPSHVPHLSYLQSICLLYRLAAGVYTCLLYIPIFLLLYLGRLWRIGMDV